MVGGSFAVLVVLVMSASYVGFELPLSDYFGGSQVVSGCLGAVIVSVLRAGSERTGSGVAPLVQ